MSEKVKGQSWANSILILLKNSHDDFQKQVPGILSKYKGKSLNRTLISNVARAAQIDLNKRLLEIYRNQLYHSLNKREAKTVL